MTASKDHHMPTVAAAVVAVSAVQLFATNSAAFVAFAMKAA